MSNALLPQDFDKIVDTLVSDVQEDFNPCHPSTSRSRLLKQRLVRFAEDLVEGAVSRTEQAPMSNWRQMFVWVGLYNEDGVEVSGESYGRVRVTFGPMETNASGTLVGVCSAHPIIFPKKAEEDWGKIVACGLFAEHEKGILFHRARLDGYVRTLGTDSLTFPAGNLSIWF